MDLVEQNNFTTESNEEIEEDPIKLFTTNEVLDSFQMYDATV